MNKLLETYIKRCILAEQHTNNNNIIKDIINKFSSEYALSRFLLLGSSDRPLASGLPLAFALAHGKRTAFWKRYDTDEAFKKQMNSSYAYNKRSYFDFWQSSDKLREYLKPELKSAEVILVEPNKASVLSLKQLERAVSEARSVEELQKLVLEEQSSKANIWFELERRLENNCEIRVIT